MFIPTLVGVMNGCIVRSCYNQRINHHMVLCRYQKGEVEVRTDGSQIRRIFYVVTLAYLHL
jgi:hypothetical protein